MIHLLLFFASMLEWLTGRPNLDSDYYPRRPRLRINRTVPYIGPGHDFTQWCMELGVSSNWRGKPDAYKHD